MFGEEEEDVYYVHITQQEYSVKEMSVMVKGVLQQLEWNLICS